MLWSFLPALPHPHPSPRCQCARTSAAFYFFFPVWFLCVCGVCFFFHSIFFPTPFYFFHLSSLLAFLRRQASLSVFTADLDLNVHTIKARGECQEWGRLSAVVREDPPRKEPRSRGALRRAQRCGFRLEGSRAPGGRSLGAGRCVMCDRPGLRDANGLGERNRSRFSDQRRFVRAPKGGGGGGGGVPVSALRSASVCLFFSRLGVHCTRADPFLRGCVFVPGLAFGVLFLKIIWHPED